MRKKKFWGVARLMGGHLAKRAHLWVDVYEAYSVCGTSAYADKVLTDLGPRTAPRPKCQQCLKLEK
jgi:hypothetical protein